MTEVTIAGGVATVGGAVFAQNLAIGSAGTGLIDPFLRVQANGDEQGFNTDATAPLDAKAGKFTDSHPADRHPDRGPRVRSRERAGSSSSGSTRTSPTATS